MIKYFLETYSVIKDIALVQPAFKNKTNGTNKEK